MDEKQTEQLGRFVNSVDEEIETQIRELLDEAQTEGETIRKHTEDNTLQEAFDKIQAEVKSIEMDYQRQLAQTEQDARREQLAHREALVEQIFDSLRTRLTAFTQTPAYPDYLCKLLEGEDLTGETIIYVSPADLQHRSALQHVAPVCKVEADEAITIGGLSLTAQDSKQIVDKTMDTALLEQRKQFSTNYTLSI